MALDVTEKGDRLSDCDFARLSAFVHDYCGIVMNDDKRTMLETRVLRLKQRARVDSAAEYCRLILDGNDLAAEEEVVRFIDAVTINKTEFFREPTHLELMRRELLPTLAAQGRSFFKTWSAACANGAEAYTMAMVLDDFRRTTAGIDFFVLGTDISNSMIKYAAYGCYPESAVTSIPLHLRRLHLLKARDGRRREFRVAPHLRGKMAFARLNLAAGVYPVSIDYDVIFCRNVLIYFDKPTQERVLRHLIGHLRPGGFLVLGHAETTMGMALDLDPVAGAVYRKR